jgi:hypothetical protein
MSEWWRNQSGANRSGQDFPEKQRKYREKLREGTTGTVRMPKKLHKISRLASLSLLMLTGKRRVRAANDLGSGPINLD